MVCAYCLVTLDEKSVNDGCGKNTDVNDYQHSKFFLEFFYYQKCF